MFKDPEEHLVIGITKSRIVEVNFGDADEVLSVARGDENNTRSFKGYKNILVIEQDIPESIQSMIEAINQ